MSSRRTSTSLLLTILAVLLSAGSAAAQAAPNAFRAAPYPNYRVGGPASLHIETDPAQIYAPVYEFRFKNGQADGPQPKLIGYTDSAGRFDLSYSSLPAGIEGSYSNERYAVGSPWGQKSSPAFNYTVAPATPLSVTCGCEHYSDEYDQICEARPSPSQPPSGGEYRYRWSTTGVFFPGPPGPYQKIVTADCLNGPLTVSVAVDLMMGGYLIESDSTQCVGGTPYCD